MAILTQLVENPALFFDRFGIIIFIFVLIDAIYDLWLNKTPYPSNYRWRAWIRFAIGLSGILVDGVLIIMQDFLGISF